MTEIVLAGGTKRSFEKDEFPRPTITLEKIASMKSVFREREAR